MADIVLHKCNPCTYCKKTNTEFVAAIAYNVYRCDACPDIWDADIDDIENIIAQHRHGGDHVQLCNGQKIRCSCNDCHREFISEIKWM